MPNRDTKVGQKDIKIKEGEVLTEKGTHKKYGSTSLSAEGGNKHKILTKYVVQNNIKNAWTETLL